MSRPRVAITIRIPEVARARVAEKCDIVHHWDKDEQCPRDVLLKWVSEIDGLYCILSDKINEELLNAAGSKLKVVSTMSVGFDHVDIPACTKRGIQVGNTPGVLTDTVADTVVALLLAVARRIPEGAQHVKNGTWPSVWIPLWMCGKDVHHSTVGIIGLGRIGYQVAKRLKAFDCHVLYYDTRETIEARDVADFVSLDEVLAKADFVVPLTPLTEQTRGMVNLSMFRKMKHDAFVVNVSRGPIVNHDDLVVALRERIIGGAGLDVTVPEPLPSNHPLLAKEFEDRVVILPHLGSSSVPTREAMALLAADNIIAGLSGQPMKTKVN